MADGRWCRKCGRLVLEPVTTAVACDCSRAEAGAVAREAVGGSSSVPGDSPVKVSDEFAWLDRMDNDDDMTAQNAKLLLNEVRRLEQIIQDANG